MMDGKTIFLVEDDDSLRELMQMMLEINGYRVFCAKDGLEAKQALEAGQMSPDLVLIDLLMPVMDGIQLLQWIRQEAKFEMPVLVMTALLQKDVEEDVLASGATGIIYKPIDIDVFIERVIDVTTGS